MGGLSAAIRLAGAGGRVTPFEQGERTGGKLNRWACDGWTFDTGPSLLTMPWVLRDLFADAGASLDASLTLDPVVSRLPLLLPADGATLDVTTDSARSGGEYRGAGAARCPGILPLPRVCGGYVRDRGGALSPALVLDPATLRRERGYRCSATDSARAI